MKKKLSMITTLAFVTLITLSAGAFAYNSGNTGHHMRKGGGPMDRQAPESYHGNRFQSRWDSLSPEQQDQIKALQQNFIDETASLRTEMYTKTGNMRILMGTSAPDSAELKRLAGEIADVKAEIMKKRIDFILKAKKAAPELKFGSSAGFGGMHGGMNSYCPFKSGMNHGGFQKGAGCLR